MSHSLAINEFSWEVSRQDTLCRCIHAEYGNLHLDSRGRAAYSNALARFAGAKLHVLERGEREQRDKVSGIALLSSCFGGYRTPGHVGDQSLPADCESQSANNGHRGVRE